MENLFVSLEVAKKLKEIKFNEICLYYYFPNCNFKMGEKYDLLSKDKYIGVEIKSIEQLYYAGYYHNCIPAPLYQQALDWFKNKYNIYIIEQLDRTAEPKYCYEIWKYEDFGNWTLISKRPEFFLHYSSVENLNDAILEALTLI